MIAVASAVARWLPFLWLLAGRRLFRQGRFREAELAAARVKSGRSRGKGLILQARALLAQGQRARAVDLLVLALEHGAAKSARGHLVALGARDRLPGPQACILSPEDYAAYQPPAPPATAQTGNPPIDLCVAIVADQANSDAQRRTLSSLQRQSSTCWRAEVIELDSLANLDRICQQVFKAGPRAAERWMLPLMAGSELRNHAIAWLLWAAAHSQADLVYADEDRQPERCSDGAGRQVILHPMKDCVWFPDPVARPALCMVRHMPKQDGDMSSEFGPGIWTAGLRAAHVPFVLGSMVAPSPLLPPARAAASPSSDAVLLSVIIPTRDNPVHLARMIETLEHHACFKDRMELIIVDNGSLLPATVDLLTTLCSRPATRVIRDNLPFNWSRVNNLGARHARGELLLFMNDDMEMLTADWDKKLASLLAAPGVGLVGARLLYPFGALQHAGFLMDMEDGPQHEGRWMPTNDGGATNRRRANRTVAAVTGAFMASSRATFEAAAGFNEQDYDVDFSDLDFCMRVRAQGQQVVYAGEIELIHYESVTRGQSKSWRERRQARREKRRFAAIWGKDALVDPGHHPAWLRTGPGLDACRLLSLDDAVAHIAASAKPNPWLIVP